MNILIAEDDNLSRELLRRIVEFDGQNKVTVARDGCEAWSLLRDPATRFDVCIIDVYMPQKDGLNLVEEMRGDGRLKGTPVILCTSADDLQTVKKAASLGVNHYIIKPYSRAVILGKLHQIGGALADDGALENSETVCTRLGIDVEMRRTLLTNLADEVEGWCRKLRSARERGQIEALLTFGLGLRGACLNLGARRTAAQIKWIESTLKESMNGSGEAAAGPAPDALLALGELERDVHLVCGRVKSAA
jgi:YesN/AraC family two-component response regulator